MFVFSRKTLQGRRVITKNVIMMKRRLSEKNSAHAPSEKMGASRENYMSLASSLLRSLALACCSIVALGITSNSVAQEFPQRPISLVVGYPAGDSVDLTARLFGEELSRRLGQSVVIENAGGAGSTIGAQRVARANPEGYTLLLGSTNEMVIAGMINTAVKYDSVKDFTPLGVIALQPMVLVASKASGVKTAEQ